MPPWWSLHRVPNHRVQRTSGLVGAPPCWEGDTLQPRGTQAPAREPSRTPLGYRFIGLSIAIFYNCLYNELANVGNVFPEFWAILISQNLRSVVGTPICNPVDPSPHLSRLVCGVGAVLWSSAHRLWDLRTEVRTELSCRTLTAVHRK